ncbi:MAG: SIR2 family protein [Pseudomonadota bacterium]
MSFLLSFFGDLIALAERAKDASAMVGSGRVHKTALQATHHKILRHIRDILRWGYRAGSDSDSEEIGGPGKPIVNIEGHRRFVRVLYKINRAGLDERREPVQFVTTNYDTLIEDALALELVPYTDGFAGGAIASWNEQLLLSPTVHQNLKAVVTKLHGSIDWYRSGAEGGRVFRVRYDDLYPDRSDSNSNVVIYPQSTKYMASREDPFGLLFQRFRDLLSAERQQVLFVCGYSFGDDHIDSIIEQYLLHPESKTTLVAFSSKRSGKLKTWGDSHAGERVFVVAADGLHRGCDGPFFPSHTEPSERDWWTFSGVTDLLENGLPADISDAIQ